jgi:hypothetical protein
MKIVKVKKRYFKDLAFLYKDLDLIINNECNPSRVLMSKQDYRTLKKTTTDLFKKQYPGIRGNKLKASVAMHLLNLGPNEMAGEAVKPGYLIILDI